MLAALIAYALLAGADFGGGVWDFFARGPRAARQRELIATAIGPIWEANHVWLIVVVVLLFSAFPPAFALIMTALHIPITAMLIGIVLRGSSFVFRTYDSRRDAVQRRWGRIFAMSSVATPVLLGIVLGTVSTPNIRVVGGVMVSGFFRPWLRLFPFCVGLFVLAQFAFLAAVYLTVDAEEVPLREDFRRRGLLAAVAVGVLAAAVLLLARSEAPRLWRGLLATGWAVPLHIATGLCAVGAIYALWARHYRTARLLAAAQVALIATGWGLAMNPFLIAETVTIRAAAAPEPTLRVILAGLAAGSLILFPALYYLFRVFKGGLIFGRLP